MASWKILVPCLALVLLFSAISLSESREFHVGAKKGLWQVPSSPDEFNKWAEKNRFQINDSIVLKYDGKTDSVLEVTEEGYKSCNTSNPIKSHNDGNTKIVLDKSGPFFFISGAEGHCEKGQKVEIKVLSPEHDHSPAVPAPSPSTNHHHSPAPAPHKNGGSALKVGFIGGFAAAGILALF